MFESHINNVQKTISTPLNLEDGTEFKYGKIKRYKEVAVSCIAFVYKEIHMELNRFGHDGTDERNLSLLH